MLTTARDPGFPNIPLQKVPQRGYFSVCKVTTAETQRHCNGSSDLPDFSSYLQWVTRS